MQQPMVEYPTGGRGAVFGVPADNPYVGRRIAPEPVSVSLAAADVVVLTASDARAGMVISAPVGSRVTIAFGRVAVLDQGLTLQPGDPPLKLTEWEFG